MLDWLTGLLIAAFSYCCVQQPGCMIEDAKEDLEFEAHCNNIYLEVSDRSG